MEEERKEEMNPVYIAGGIALALILLGSSNHMSLNTEEIKRLKNYGSAFGLKFDKWTLLAIRGATLTEQGTIKQNKNVLNEWNDLFVLIKGNEAKAWKGTTDPGKKYSVNPKVSAGAFRILPGLYYYQSGLHDGKDAFVSASPISGLRDTNKDLIWDSNDKVYTDSVGNRFWINLHASYTGKFVDGTSAGCMALYHGWKSSEWKEFRDTLKGEYGKAKFPVLVLESKVLT